MAEKPEDFIDAPDEDVKLGFSKFLLADTEFAIELDDILKKGPVYQKLGMSMLSKSEIENKV